MLFISAATINQPISVLEDHQMFITISGSLGLGFVWGWLVRAVGCQAGQPRYTHLALIVVTLLLTAEVSVLTYQWMSLLFLSAVLFSQLLHYIWDRQLHHRFVSSDL